VQNAVIDGEIVCLDAEGRSIFNELLFRRGSPIFYAFDLLYLNGRDLRQLPLTERKEKLGTSPPELLAALFTLPGNNAEDGAQRYLRLPVNFGSVSTLRVTRPRHKVEHHDFMSV
jgi:ATP-dependent DNA ligase